MYRHSGGILGSDALYLDTLRFNESFKGQAEALQLIVREAFQIFGGACGIMAHRPKYGEEKYGRVSAFASCRVLTSTSPALPD